MIGRRIVDRLCPVVAASLVAVGVASCGKTAAPPAAEPTIAAPPTEPTRTTRKQKERMRIRINTGDRELTATLDDSEAARDFASLLPLTLTMNDLFRQEKYARLPRAISEKGKRTHTYAAGEIAYWAPGPDVAIYYRNGEGIPEPGVVVLGKLDVGAEALDVAGSVRVTIEIVK